MIDHIGFVISDYEKSKNFYTKSLSPLGIELVMEEQGWAGFGKKGKAEFWFGPDGQAHKRMHVAFLAETRSQVDAFYEAALSAGATDNGKPGVREIYHPNYYGAFVIDPDGHNIEAVCHS
ncbi:VOC family protein [Candidatus Persebacteraceae bacterium Df01]|uniref:VOC family protein n=1 Tax=Candidatus Doriopsillibacter californiensis TaxID=2970740 RepID=A0ABT7QM46_9GAMM|nr:VOC family protein [Candidatus Persebacteraceae bacterium Df01]